MSKLVTVAVGAFCGYVGYKVGKAAEKESRKHHDLEISLNSVPWELRDEGRKAAIKVAEVTGDETDEIDVKSVIVFADRKVYVIDSEFKGYGCSVDKDGNMEVSERLYDWL